MNHPNKAWSHLASHSVRIRRSLSAIEELLGLRCESYAEVEPMDAVSIREFNEAVLTLVGGAMEFEKARKAMWSVLEDINGEGDDDEDV